MTERQILLLHEAELRRRKRQRAEDLIDINHAFAGGDHASQQLKKLQPNGLELSFLNRGKRPTRARGRPCGTSSSM